MTEQRNEDGDTLAEIKAVWKRFSRDGVECFRDGEWIRLTHDTLSWGAENYRILAKYADRFDPDCMDFEVWARAAIGRGEVVRLEYASGNAFFHDVIKDSGSGMWCVNLHGVQGTSWEAMTGKFALLSGTSEPPAVIPHVEAPADGEWFECGWNVADEYRCRDKCAGSVWGRWCPMKIYTESSAFSIFEFRKRTATAKPASPEVQGGVYPECVNEECPTFGAHGCLEELDVNGTCECRTDISEKSDGKRPAGEPRWAKTRAEAQGGKCATCIHAHVCRNDLKTRTEQCPYYEPEQPRPAFDVQAAVDRVNQQLADMTTNRDGMRDLFESSKKINTDWEGHYEQLTKRSIELRKALERIECAADNRGVDNPSDEYIRGLCRDIAKSVLAEKPLSDAMKLRPPNRPMSPDSGLQRG